MSDLAGPFRRVRIEVTRDDIEAGVATSTYACPIARAMNRTLPLDDQQANEAPRPLVGWAVSSQAVQYSRKHHGRAVMVGDLPAEAIAFIQDFDNDGDVEPLAFDVLVRDVVTS